MGVPHRRIPETRLTSEGRINEAHFREYGSINIQVGGKIGVFLKFYLTEFRIPAKLNSVEIRQTLKVNLSKKSSFFEYGNLRFTILLLSTQFYYCTRLNSITTEVNCIFKYPLLKLYLAFEVYSTKCRISIECYVVKLRCIELCCFILIGPDI